MKAIFLLVSSMFIFIQLFAQQTDVNFLLEKNMDEFSPYYEMAFQLNNHILFKNEKTLKGDRTDAWIEKNWVKQDSTAYIYNTDGTSEKITREFIDSAWVFVNRVITDPNAVCDPSNGIIEPSVIRQKWGETSWVNYIRDFRTLNDNEQTIKLIREQWDGEAWVSYLQFFFEYDTDHSLISYFSKRWSDNEWENSSKTIYSYDLYGQIKTRLLQLWIGDEWINNALFTYTYKDSLLTNMLSGGWDWDSDWINNLNYTYEYDSNNNRISELIEDWSVNSWINYLKYTYEYDTTNLVTYKLFEKWDGNNWFDVERTFYYYDQLTTNLNFQEPQKITFTIFPNPNNGYFQLSFPNKFLKNSIINVFNINGKLIYCKTLTAGNKSNSIELVNPVSGKYILSVLLNNTLYSEVFVVY